MALEQEIRPLIKRLSDLWQARLSDGGIVAYCEHLVPFDLLTIRDACWKAEETFEPVPGTRMISHKALVHYCREIERKTAPPKPQEPIRKPTYEECVNKYAIGLTLTQMQYNCQMGRAINGAPFHNLDQNANRAIAKAHLDKKIAAMSAKNPHYKPPWMQTENTPEDDGDNDDFDPFALEDEPRSTSESEMPSQSSANFNPNL